MTESMKEIVNLYEVLSKEQRMSKSEYKPEPLPADHEHRKQRFIELAARWYADEKITSWEGALKVVDLINVYEMKTKHPKNLDEAVDIIMKQLEAERLLINATEEEGKGDKISEEVKKKGFEHHGYGMHLRNNWYLWWSEGHHYYPSWPSVKPAIVQWFNERDIYHADDMSGIINEALQAKLKGKPYDILPTIQRYKNHWKKQGFKDGIPKHENKI